MVGRMTLDHLIQVRILVLQPFLSKNKIRKRRYRLGVRTGDSQSSNRGSIPRSATTYLVEKQSLLYHPTLSKLLSKN